MKNLAERLEKRGWGRKDIIKAVGIIKNAKNKKTNHFLGQRVYWILLLTITIGNFAVMLGIIPALMLLKGPFLYFIIILLGLMFGLLFELLIRTIEHLERRHHLWLALFIPIVAVVNGFFISRFSNTVSYNLGIKNYQNPVLIALVYAFSFVLPYVIYRFVLKIEYYSNY